MIVELIRTQDIQNISENTATTRFICLYHQKPEAYSGPFETSKMVVSGKIVNVRKLLTICAKGLSFNVWRGCECIYDSPYEYYSVKASGYQYKKMEPSISRKLTEDLLTVCRNGIAWTHNTFIKDFLISLLTWLISLFFFK